MSEWLKCPGVTKKMERSRKMLAFIVILVAVLGTGAYYLFYGSQSPAASVEMAGHQERDDGYYTVVDENGRVIFTTGHLVVVGDEFIAEDDTKYTIVRVSGDVATARTVGKMQALPPLPYRSEGAKIQGSVAIYHTHSDESYIPSDGSESIPGRGGVFRVGASMSEKLNRLGIKAIHDTTGHDPHDARAYDRSRRTASRLLRKYRPLALFDVHRDAGPPEPYLKEVDGKEVAKGMIVIGRQNPKMQANLEFARRLKDAVNKRYPGLIKGIFLGSANFNQDLYERSLLLEMGTEKTTRQAAEAGSVLIANVVPTVLQAVGPGAFPESRGAGRAIGWLLGLAVAGIFIYLWISTGSWEEMKAKILAWFGAGGIRIGGGGHDEGDSSASGGEGLGS